MTQASLNHKLTRQLGRARADQRCTCPTCGSSARREVCTLRRPGQADATQTITRCLRTAGGPRCAVVKTEVTCA